MLGREWKWIGESRSGPDGMEKLQKLTGGLFRTMVMGAIGLVAFRRIVGGEGGGGRGGGDYSSLMWRSLRYWHMTLSGKRGWL